MRMTFRVTRSSLFRVDSSAAEEAADEQEGKEGGGYSESNVLRHRVAGCENRDEDLAIGDGPEGKAVIWEAWSGRKIRKNCLSTSMEFPEFRRLRKG